MTARRFPPPWAAEVTPNCFIVRDANGQAMAVFDIWLAALCDHRGSLAPGEVGIALIISRDQRASQVMLGFIEGIMLASEPLRSMIVNRTADSIELRNNIRIEIRPCNRVASRGATCISIVADELAHWFTAADFANPDEEVLGSARPTLLTTGGPTLMVSSAYAKRGVLYDSFKKYFGPSGRPDTLVAYATSRDLNPSLPQHEIDRELEKDPTRNRAEYLSEWRSDVEGFLPRELVEACVRSYYELPPQPNIIYLCFVDPASGVPEGDSFAAVVAHKLGDRIIIDAIREVQPPFNFFEVVETVLVPLCKAYRIHKVWGDNYAGELAKLPIRKAGISYELAEKHTSQLYLDPFLGMLNAGKIDLPNHPRAINQICSLERSVSRGGHEQITHPIRGHDDIANCIAGAVDLALNRSSYDFLYRGWSGEPDRTPPPQPEPDRGQYAGTGDWWRVKEHLNTYTTSDARGMYTAIDNYFKYR